MIETKRFYLREKRLSDAKDMYLLNANPEVLRYTGDIPFKDVKEAEAFIKSYDHFAVNGFGRWVIEDKSTKEYLGWCGLKRHSSGMIDLGYRIKKEHWDKGIASECAHACLHYGFTQLKLEKIVGRSARANNASIRILEKIEMNFWKKDMCDDIKDAVWYTIDRQTYLKQIGSLK